MTPAERQKLRRDRRKAGLVRIEVWVPRDKANAVMTSIKSILESKDVDAEKSQ